ncbi:hypothetical protein [Acidithiobacillus thiooxidans]|uniref:Uncharacterized protein n=1 Tax=Acidithiobacillus thiooxidans ATCC 19377 TaxID=637390 RepID=A0A543PYI0_ACITH|nr:hypothetical protein [Acidithiobacillus thiooxidans]MDX5936792.1 hypothetical protein [Acidithiobacillus thiooxidans]MDX5936801.1 hypothetical protein [Acidithiobacillus thiooxidans]MDX5936810.1 hypothetical protein [Acidithiobacillus thiooxidans]TQN49154.1 hypothetical protein DLNHIDIE_03533 [Acidithiobacillus thiooxidans ATCC 19377]
MAMTVAERQAKYREKALKDPDGLLLTRVQTMLSPPAAANLGRLQKVTGWTQRQCIQEAITRLAKELNCDTE